MKVLVTAMGPSIDSPVDERFGRSRYFIVYDIESGDFESIENPHTGEHGGVGVSVAKLCIDKGVRAVISGSFGPNAQETLKMASIDMYVTDGSLSVKEVVDRFKKGSLSHF